MKERPSDCSAQRVCAGFSLIEILVAVSVVTMMVVILGQLMGHATTVTRTGSKHIDTDTQARVVLDRMAIDITQMLKRTDVDYYVKGSGGYTGHGNGHGNGHKVTSGQQGSDQIAFSAKYRLLSPRPVLHSPLSSSPIESTRCRPLPSLFETERMGKGLLWNGVSNARSPMQITRIVATSVSDSVCARPNAWRRPPARGPRHGDRGPQRSQMILAELE